MFWGNNHVWFVSNFSYHVILKMIKEKNDSSHSQTFPFECPQCGGRKSSFPSKSLFQCLLRSRASGKVKKQKIFCRVSLFLDLFFVKRICEQKSLY